MPSIFPNGIDSFQKHYDPPISLLPTIAEYETLRSKVNKTVSEQSRYEALAMELAPYIFTTEELNMMQDSMVNMQTFFLQEVDKWVEERVTQFAYKGIYSSETVYLKDNIVRYKNSLYTVISNSVQNVEPTDPLNWSLMMPNQKGDKGDKGDPGANLLFRSQWRPQTDYRMQDLVCYGFKLYACVVGHTSGDTFDSLKWELVMASDNIDMQQLAIRLQAFYRSDVSTETGNTVVTEKIVQSIGSGEIFDETGDGAVIITCSTNVVQRGDQLTVTQVYDDKKHLFSPSDSFTTQTDVLNGKLLTRRI